MDQFNAQTKHCNGPCVTDIPIGQHKMSRLAARVYLASHVYVKSGYRIPLNGHT